ncbi:hypothetical protein [Microtetraspora malaysiensis]|uniref:Uncharacterized protein n=1 Tax=Microtetraspora malaysiensis TaxID=161358 RepID=A0ABW6T7W7_9ACTN
MKATRLLPYPALLVAGVFYVHGIWEGRFLELRPTSEYCADKPLAFPATSWTWLPLTHQCRWSDGTTTDLVPAYVNPVVYACLALVLACIVMAVRAARRNRRQPLK